MNADVEATDRWKVGLIGVLTDAAAVCSPIIAKKNYVATSNGGYFLKFGSKNTYSYIDSS